jgi:penicillin-binding protein 1A
MAALTTCIYFLGAAPPLPNLERYSNIASGVTRMYAADGTLMGEFAKERREVVPYERVPKRLIDAFLAVEDHEFFEHRGLYFKGIVRAAWRNIASGDFEQGGSTITQQVAKQFLGAEKSLSRKGKEAVMARRLEAQYSKQAILAVYLNHIYLGAGAWGVGPRRNVLPQEPRPADARECALIAGSRRLRRILAGHEPKLAIERRNVVLTRCSATGSATARGRAAKKSSRSP